MPQERPGKSILMTPDPYHTPGYCGFCPQFKYQIGETFGKTTSRLLTNPGVASSGRPVLAETYPRPSTEFEVDQRVELVRTRTQSWGDQKLVTNMVPGYTGYIPKGQHYFGTRYADSSLNAISDFERDQRAHSQKMDELRMINAIQSGRMSDPTSKKLLTARYPSPLKAVSPTAKPYSSKFPSNIVHRYTGFVPKARGLLGMGYPNLTHDALNEFTTEFANMEARRSQPVTLERPAMVVRDTKLIYPIHSGLVPHYTGHIPGQKFRYGTTFGHSTLNARRLPRGSLLTATL
ncbi:ciliary microtubule inner protein 2B-like [Ptychodera flava]|uniref:ciliary microtubule inner protein 2B-like n=1 Tax=Ptychodera flava TaxID=63121 RepID=UPI00396A5EC2